MHDGDARMQIQVHGGNTSGICAALPSRSLCGQLPFYRVSVVTASFDSLCDV